MLKVEGMSCNHCVRTIEYHVGALAGVFEVEVTLAKGKVTVMYDEETLSTVQIAHIIDEQGFVVVCDQF